MRRLIVTCLVLSLPPIACNDDGKGTEETETGTGDGDGDPTGDGDGEPTGDGDGDGEPTGDGDGDGDGDPTGDGDGDGDGEPNPEPECRGANECAVVNDCCTCDVVPADMVPPCDIRECLVLTCTPIYGGGEPPPAACRVGSCEFEPVSCDLAEVFCDIQEPPPCEDGLVRSVIDNCYGECVPPRACDTLPFECDASTCGDGYACMTSQSGAVSRCVPLPPGCEDQPSCDCLAPWWTEVCDGGCGDNGETLLCEDGG